MNRFNKKTFILFHFIFNSKNISTTRFLEIKIYLFNYSYKKIFKIFTNNLGQDFCKKKKNDNQIE
jgi:hypothetical protein